jgi:bisphosphoglycerate-independent phosphoglycerate mutase (AlkP superfamily)
MGYESKLFIVEKHEKLESDPKKYASVIAMFDMCKIGNLTDVFKQNTDCYFFADDGNTRVLKDKYGDVLKEASVEDVIQVLENAVTSGETYRRIAPLLSTLKTIFEQQKNNAWKDIAILHYGY